MKFNLKNWMMLIALILCIPVFSSCSDDDDKDGGSGKCSGYFTAEGKTTKFKYGYLVNFDDDNGDVQIEMCDIDILYYRDHPSKLSSSTKMSFAAISLGNTSKNVSDDSFTDYDIEVGLGVYILLDDDTEGVCDAAYTTFGRTIDPIKYERNGNNFTIEGINISMALPNDGSDGWTSSRPIEYVDASFGLSGVPTDVTVMDDDYDDGYYSARGEVKFKVVTDPDEIEYLKKLRSKIRIKK